MRPNTAKLSQQVRAARTPEAQLAALASQYQGETAYIFSCGPSLGEVWSEALAVFLQDKLVIAVKQALTLMATAADFHVFNRCRIQEYQYRDPAPIRMAIEIEPFPHQADIRLPFVINPSQKWMNSVLFSHALERGELSRGSARCYGPGIMLELGIYLPVHLGCKRVVFFGWDMNPVEPTHFYRDLQQSAPVHLEEHVVVSNLMPRFVPRLTKWYESHGVSAFLCSPRSAIPLPQLSVNDIIGDSSCKTKVNGSQTPASMRIIQTSLTPSDAPQPGPTSVGDSDGTRIFPGIVELDDERLPSNNRESREPSSLPRAEVVSHPWMPHIQAGHFTVAPTEAHARALFKSAVQMVEIEVHSFCNRRCWFCSNTVVDRRSAVHLMAPKLYRSILNQLAEIQYDKLVSFSRYNEPFSNPVIFERIAEARTLLPHAVLHANTNGDYLKPDMLRVMADAGLNSLNIQCYLKDTEAYDHEKVKLRFGNIVDRLGLEMPVTKDIPNEWFEGAGRHQSMNVRVYGRNFAINGTSRGDTVEIAREYVRQSPCLSPFWHFYVDWNGCVVPCCNLRSEVPAHREAILATLTPESSLFQVFAGKAARGWRRHLASFEAKAGVCRSCTFVTTEHDAGLDARMRSLQEEAGEPASNGHAPQPDQKAASKPAVTPAFADAGVSEMPQVNGSPAPALIGQPEPPHFLSFLLPFVDRGQGPLYQWVMLLQAATFGPDGVTFIGDERYFQAPWGWGKELEHFGYRYRSPSREEWESFSKHCLPRSIFTELERRSSSMLDAFRILLTEDYAPLREAIESLLAETCRTRKPDAILSWCHVPSLILAAAKFGIPVIHNELGPLRPPIYRGTVYFDFNGVNGFTSAEPQMYQFAREAAGWNDFCPLSLDELRQLLIVAPAKRSASLAPPAFKAGAALQVEDDSNLLAFSKGMTNFELIFAARKGLKPEQLLVRQHPHGHARYSDKLGVPDTSPDAIEFLSRCEQLFTTNSSVAFESLLQGKLVTILGDSPAAGLSRERLEAMPEAKRLLCLNWLFVGYLVPASKLFDAEYYRWRLTNPPLREIYERHLALHRAGNEPAARPTTPRLNAAPSLPEVEGRKTGNLAVDRSRTSGRPTQKILFVSHEASRTGAPMFLLHLLRWLRVNTKVEFRVLLGRGGPLEPEFHALAETFSPDTFGTDGRLLADVDLIYSNTCANGGWLNTLPCGDIPIVTHFHELDYVIELLGAENLNLVRRQTSRYIACSQAVADGLQQRQQISAERISVHHEMISVAHLMAQAAAQSPHEARAKHGLPADAFVIAGCGTAEWRKGPDLFLQLAATLQRRIGARVPLRFVWIGLLPDDERGRILRLDRARLGLDHVVQFTGELENPHTLLNACDLFCLPSREDPFPLVMLEAGALSKPFVCFDGSGGAKEFASLGAGFAVCHLDVEGMAVRCVELIENADLRREIGSKAAQLVRERFDVDAAAPRLWQMIETLRGTEPDSPARWASRAEKILQECEPLVERGDFAAAAERLELVVTNVPDHLEATLALGNVRCALGDIESAAGHLEHATALAPQHAPALARLAMLRVQQDRLADAETSARRALALEPGRLDTLQLLAALTLHAGRPAEAHDLFLQIARLDPKNLEARLGQAQCCLSQGHTVLAQLILEELLETHPHHAEARALLAKLDVTIEMPPPVARLGQPAAAQKPRNGKHFATHH